MMSNGDLRNLLDLVEAEYRGRDNQSAIAGALVILATLKLREELR